MVTVPSSPIETNAKGSSTHPSAMPSAPYLGLSSARRAAGNPTARTSPPSADIPTRKPRRLTFANRGGLSGGASPGAELIESSGAFIRRSFLAGRTVDGRANPGVRAAATDVAAHRRVDVGIRWLGSSLEQRSSGHDLAGLAVAALRHADLDPRRLHSLADAVLADRLDRGDLRLRHRRDRRDAGAHGLAIDV